MKVSLSLLLLLSALGTAMADVSTANRTLLFNDDFDTLSASQDGKGTQWNYIDYVSWDNVNARNWRTYQSNDPALTEIRTEGDTSFVSLWGKKGNYHTENTSTSNANKVVGTDVYACGGLFTQKTFTFQYGYVEARARFDCVQGCWPAIWMLPAAGQNWPNNGEIDILEHLNSETTAYQTLHFFADNGTSDASAGLQGKITGELTGWHTYGMEWTENAITFYVDGTKTGTITGDAYTNWPFDRENNEFYLMIDQQIGGNWVEGTKGIDDKTLSERGAALDIDYIRVYSAESTDSNIWKNGSTGAWETGVILADFREWQSGSNMNFVGTTGTVAAGDVAVSHLNIKANANLRLEGGTITADNLTIAGDAEVSGPGTHLTISGNLNVGTLYTEANKWLSTVHLTVEDGGHAAIDTVEGVMVNDKIGQAFFGAQGSGILTIGTLNSAGGVVNINAQAADTGRVTISEAATFYQINLSHGELDMTGAVLTTNEKIHLKGGTLLWGGKLNDSKLSYEGGAVRLTSLPSGDLTLEGKQKAELDYVLKNSNTGNITIASGTGLTILSQTADGNGNYTKTITVQEGGTLVLSGDTTNANRVLAVGTGGTIANSGEVLVDSSNTGDGTKWVNGMQGNGKVVSEAKEVVINQSSAGFTGSLEVRKGGTLKLNNAQALDTLDAALGTITLAGKTAVRAQELRINADGKVNVYSTGTTEATLTVSGLVNAANGSHLNADLVLADGAVFNVSGSGAAGSGLIMGSSITLSDKVVLGSDVVHGLASGATSYVLATSMDGFITDGGARIWKDGGTGSAADYFTLASADTGLISLSDYTLGYTGTDGNGVLTLSLSAPEPATATLSLLALASLAARRRR